MSVERFKPREVVRQKDNQTCLPCCLLTYYSVLYPEMPMDYKAQEKALFESSFGLYPQNYALTYAAAFTRMYPDTKVEMNIHSKTYSEYLSQRNKEGRVAIHSQPISLSYIKEELQKNPLIVYTDAYYLKKGDVHVPHFIYLFEDATTHIMTVDPAYGEMRKLEDSELENAIMGLRFNMLWSPITLKVKRIDSKT